MMKNYPSVSGGIRYDKVDDAGDAGDDDDDDGHSYHHKKKKTFQISVSSDLILPCVPSPCRSEIPLNPPSGPSESPSSAPRSPEKELKLVASQEIEVYVN